MIDIELKDITENNRFQKVENLKKCLNGEKVEAIKKDNSTPLFNSIKMSLNSVSPNYINKAVRHLSFTLGVPLKSAKGEAYYFKSQEDLTDRWCERLSKINNELYELLTDYFDLPIITVMSKAVLKHKGKVIYSPESGRPITISEWKKFVATLQRFIDSKYNGVGERIVLDSVVLGKLLDRMSQNQTKNSIKNLKLKDLKLHNQTFDYITEDIKNIKNAFGEDLSRNEQARIYVMQQSAGERVTQTTDNVRNSIKRILIDGVKNKQTKGQVSQNLFNSLVGANRDLQRIADTEIQNASNIAYINEAVQNADKGEKVYFKRIEIIDKNTCDYCKRMNGKIAIYSSVPLTDDHISDDLAEFALWDGHEWEGGSNRTLHAYSGIFHPYCRGVWVKLDKFDIEDELKLKGGNK